jgi:hypothetical protein
MAFQYKLFLNLTTFFILVSILDYIKVTVNTKFFYCNSTFFILFCFVILAGGRFFLSAGDWSIYRYYFENVVGLNELNDLESISGGFDPGYFFINSIIKLFTSNHVTFFTSIEIIACILLYNNINTYTKYKISFLCIYFPYIFFSLDLVLMRSMLAVQVFFFSIRYIYNKRYISYFICIIIALSIHISSIILFPLYFVLNRYFTNKMIVIVIFIGLILFISKIDILNFLLDLVPSSFYYIYIKVISYRNSEEFGISRSLSITQIEYLLFFILLIKYRTKLNKANKYFNIFFNMYFIYGILLFYFFGVVAFSGRLKFFFVLSIPFFIPYFVKLFRKNFMLVFMIYSLYVITLMIFMFYRWEAFDVYRNYFFLKK